MKILEINKFNFVAGGADKHFLDLTSLLKAKGNEVAVFSMKHPKNKFSPWKKYFVSYVGFKKKDKLKAKLKGFLRIYSLESKRKIARLLDDFEPEIVHIHNIYHHLSPSIFSEIKKRNIPIIMTIHDYHLIDPNYLGEDNKTNWKEINFKKCWEFVSRKRFKNSYLKSALAVGEFAINKHFGFYDNVDLFIAPSQFSKKKLLRARIKKEKIMVIPHFSQGNYEMQKSCDRKLGKYVIYFGEISRQKGVDKLVKIFAERKDVKLYLAGRVKDGFVLPKNKNIKYIGFLNSTNLNDYIKNSLFVVSYSRLPETFGLIALEALKNGKPFIGFSGNAYGEIVESNKQGYLSENHEEFEKYINKLITDDGLRILFSRNALERAKDFDSDDYYDKIISTFEYTIQANKKLTPSELVAKLES
jgi:glycosyltransferase involved in cell wall biosynthesis